MKKIYTAAIVALTAVAPLAAGAQYYGMVNQATDMVRTALTGGLNYKGFVDASYTAGVGNRRADLLELTTTQGFQYSSWFFMGIGMGVDVMFAHSDPGYGPGQSGWAPGYDTSRSYTSTGVMIPLYTSFRFTTGIQNPVAFFADIRVGASFLVGRDYIRIDRGYLSNSECFYLRPTIGVRIQTDSSHPRRAINLGVNYQLITSNYRYSYSNSTALSSVGVSIGYEW